MKYLIPVIKQRHHSVVSHILADDGQTALCVAYMNNVRAWPRVSENDWMIADEPTDGYVCSRCRQAKFKMESPPAPKSPRKNRRRERELEKLARWNAAASKTK